MGDKDRPDVTDTLVPYGELTRKLDLIEAAARSRREAEKPDPVHLTDAEIREFECSFVLSEN